MTSRVTLEAYPGGPDPHPELDTLSPSYQVLENKKALSIRRPFSATIVASVDRSIALKFCSV